jgi:hypothetical protein
VAARQLGMHAILKLTNKEDESLGQTVISVAQLLSASQRESLQVSCMPSSVARELLVSIIADTQQRRSSDGCATRNFRGYGSTYSGGCIAHARYTLRCTLFTLFGVLYCLLVIESSAYVSA